MKKIILLVLGLCFTTSLAWAGYVQGYTRSDGTYVQGHYRSDANNTVTDNYSYKGNTNPYTLEQGSSYYRHDSSSEYYDGSSKKLGSADGDEELGD